MSDFFPVECSILSSGALCEQILPHYALLGSRHCHLLQHGDNDTYLVHHEQDKYILRVWQKDTRPREEIEAEMGLLSLLAQGQVPVARPLKRGDGIYLTAVNAPEGERLIGLFGYAAGKVPGKQITPEQSYAYGWAVAAMHQRFDSITHSYPRPPLNLQTLLETPVAALMPWLGHRPADEAYLMTLAETLTAQVSAVPLIPPLYGLCHGDLHKTNLLWTPEGQLTLLDFDLCGYGWRAYDLAVLFWSTRYLPQAEAVRAAYLEGYTTLRPLHPLEFQALPYFVAIRDIYITATELDHARRGVMGSDAINEAFFDEHFQFIRRWMAAIEAGSYQAL
jgi:Ser/Thr protein kinase RdoA (MazF antagonist)